MAQGQSWMENGYVIALFQVLMGFGLVWLIRSTYQLVGYIRNRASTKNEPVSTPNRDLELGELNGQEVDGVDLNVGLEATQGCSLPQPVRGSQEHDHRQHADDTANIGGSVGLELGELNGQVVDDVDFHVGREVTQGISLPQRVYHPQEHGHRQHAALEDLTPTL